MASLNGDVDSEQLSPKSEEKSASLTLQNVNRTPVSDLSIQTSSSNQNAPDCELSFEWCYGFKGNETRSNLFYISQDEIVYFTAAIGIVHHVDAQRKKGFIFHSDDILSLALHPGKQLVATGQKKDLVNKVPQIAVWDLSTLDTVSIIKGDKENAGFSALAFSPNGSLLVSANLTPKHSIAIWNWSDGRLIAESSAGDRILDLLFNPVNSQIISCGVRNIKFWNLKGNTLTGKPGQFGKTATLQTIFCVGLSPDGSLTYAGMSDGNIYVFQDYKFKQSLPNSHSSVVLSISSNAKGFVSSSKDGTVKLWSHEDLSCLRTFDLSKNDLCYAGIQIRTVFWDSDYEKLLCGTRKSEIYQLHVETGELLCIESGHAEGELWGLAIHPFDTFFASGSCDGTLRVWNWKTKKLCQINSYHKKIRSVCYSPDVKYLAFGTAEGSLFVVAADNIQKEEFSDHNRKECIQVVAFSPNSEYLAAGNNQNSIDIFSVSKDFNRIGVCKGASSFISHLDWSADSSILQCNSGARERLFYQISPDSVDRVSLKKEDTAQIVWHTIHSLLNDEISGIWQKYQVLNDINNIDTNFKHNIIATGDDDCKVNLYNYPVFKKGAKSRKYKGHCSHVTNVKFTHDLSCLLSMGGEDHTILQWQVNYCEESLLSVPASDDDATGTGTSDLDAIDSDLECEKSKVIVTRKVKKYTKKKLTPDISSPDTAKIGKSTLPTQNLELEYVHGYRGYDCRDNLFYTTKGDIVYHIAAVGIVYDKNEKKQRFYTQHSDDILCLDIHPSRTIVATGQIGAKPPIHIWDTETMQTLSIIEGFHTRGICAMDFSCDGTLLASIGLDDDHSIAIYNWRTAQLQANASGHKDRIFMIRWNPFKSDELITVGIKHIKFWNRIGSSMKNRRGVLPKDKKNTTLLCITFSYSGDKSPVDSDPQQLVFTGAADGNIYVWNAMVCTRIQPAHDGPIYSIITMDDAYLSGGKDSTVVYWNENLTKKLREVAVNKTSFMAGQPFSDTPCIRSIDFQGNTLIGTKENEIIEITPSSIIVLVRGHCQGEVWGLAHDPKSSNFATVSDDATLRIWSMDMLEMLNLKTLPDGARAISYSNNGKYIAVGLLTGKILFYFSESLDLKGELANRKSEITVLKFSPDDRYLAVASKDREIDIYSTSKESRVGVCKGSSGTIVHLDWDVDSKIIMVDTMARETLFYEAPKGKRISIMKSSMPDWHTYTCSLSEDMKGVWYEGADITDVNSVDLNQLEKLIATADDLGYVRLYNHPTTVLKAKNKKYVGHSAHVTCVRWSTDNVHLVSLGGNDTSIFIWKIAGKDSQISRSNVAATADSSTDDEAGYDTDVDWENNIDYSTKIYEKPGNFSKIDVPMLESPSDKGRHQNVCKTKVTVKVGTEDFNSLKLEHIFGYRGYDCRSNLYFLDANHIVYFAAAVGIVQDLENNLQWFYDQHNDDILCISIFKNEADFKESFIATGQIGVNADIHVWKPYSPDAVSVLSGKHEKGVCSLSFSHSGELLASLGIDDTHQIVVWNWKEGFVVAQVDASLYRLFQILFINTPKTKLNEQVPIHSLITCGISHLKYWNVTGSKMIYERLSLGTDQPTETILSTFELNTEILIVGSISGQIYIFENLIVTKTLKMHNGPIWALAKHPDGILSGSRGSSSEDVVLKLFTIDEDGSAKDIATKKVAFDVRAIDFCDGKIIIGTKDSSIILFDGDSNAVLNQGHGSGELWGLALHPSKMIAFTASHDCCLKSWNLETRKVICSLDNFAYPIQSLDISQNADLIAVGFCNGQFTLFPVTPDGNIDRESTLKKRRDYPHSINALRISPDSSKIAVSYSKNFVEIYTLPNLTKHSTCRGAKGIVTNLDWAEDTQSIQVNTSNFERLIFRISDANIIQESDVINHIVWASNTCVYGPDLVGIWPPGANSGDINISHLSNRGNILATGDDFGLVKLLNFPVNKKNAAFLSFHGHSAHVTNLKFTFNDRYLISTGGDDSCVFIWKTVKEN